MSDLQNNTMDQLAVLRGLTKTTGVLHEAQVLQLKLWPMVVLTHATASEFTFDWEKREVEFRVSAKGKAPKDMQRRLEALDGWVKTLLGEEYVVRVYVRGKLAFTGNRKIAIPEKKEPQYDREKFEEGVWRGNFEKVLGQAKREFDSTRCECPEGYACPKCIKGKTVQKDK